MPRSVILMGGNTHQVERNVHMDTDHDTLDLLEGASETRDDDRRSFGRVIGRYTLSAEIASGGMASIHYGRLIGPAGFSRAVAIKQLHPQFAKDPEFVSMFLEEARVAARVRHPNVVPVLDVVARAGELFLVMDYVHGESLASILRACQKRGTKPPLSVAVAILIDVLRGLDAAHEVRDEREGSLSIVHRDISPQNVLVSLDGLSRVLDFGIAKVAGRTPITGQGQLKGKLGYMAPEQLGCAFPISRRTDIYSAGVVLWEVLTMRRLFPVDELAAVPARLAAGEVPRVPSEIDPSIPHAIDDVVRRATAHDPEHRYETAMQMAEALEAAVRPATLVEVGKWTKSIIGEDLAARSERIAKMEALRGNAPESGSRPTPLAEDESRTAPDLRAENTEATTKVEKGETFYQGPLERVRSTLGARRSRRAMIAMASVLLIGLVAMVVLHRPRGGRPGLGESCQQADPRGPTARGTTPALLGPRRAQHSSEHVSGEQMSDDRARARHAELVGERRNGSGNRMSLSGEPATETRPDVSGEQTNSTQADDERENAGETDPAEERSSASRLDTSDERANGSRIASDRTSSASSASATWPPAPSPGGRSSRAQPSVSAKPPKCDPPYVVDSLGIRHIKRECL